MAAGHPGRSRAMERSGRWVFKLMALVACAGMALTAGAAEDRAVKSRVAPVYPEIAKRLHVTGVVKLEVTVDAEGKVTDVKTVSGNHSLAVAAEDAVHKWKFVPAAAETKESVEVKFDM